MSEYSKYNIIYRLQRWLDSVPGQTFLNYAYSWGASVVILGTLFKLTHLPGANLMLYIGMGTEVVVFFISAFDRPFDKTAIGKDIPTHVTEEYLEGSDSLSESEADGVQIAAQGAPVSAGTTIVVQSQPGYQGTNQPIIFDEKECGETAVASENQPSESAEGQKASSLQPTTWIQNQQQVSPEMAEATSNYVEELNKLTEMLGKVSEQSSRLTRDSEEMENLNRTLTGICKVYEMQLKGASAQIGTIDQINEQSRKMAQQIEQLNKIYTRMIEAMTVNMRVATNNGNNSEV